MKGKKICKDCKIENGETAEECWICGSVLD